jgi:predicted phosphodiesterase
LKILVIADIHGNATALSAVLNKEADADTTVFLGDVVLGGPQPNETIELLQGLPGTFIEGNHDIEMLKPDSFNKWPDDWKAFTQFVLDALSPTGYELLRGLSPEGEYEVGGIPMLLHHGVLPSKPNQGLPNTPDDRLAAIAEGSDCPLILFGHSHVQFERTIDGKRFINPGSVGQSRCGQRLACYGVFEDGVYQQRHTEYDPAPWLAAMDDIGPLDAFPEFRSWLKQGFLDGYSIGKNEPWTGFAGDGYI